MTNFVAAVRSSDIDAKSNLVGFQGDFTFDERMVTFQNEPVQKAGLTGGNWNVSGNVLPGPGPIRTLRVSAYSNDFKPLSGSGTLFNLNMTRVSKAAQGTRLIWAAAPDQFIFIDAALNTQKPGNAASGSVTPSGEHGARSLPECPAVTCAIATNICMEKANRSAARLGERGPYWALLTQLLNVNHQEKNYENHPPTYSIFFAAFPFGARRLSDKTSGRGRVRFRRRGICGARHGQHRRTVSLLARARR